ncbi:putative Phosphomevalonate kinase [Seiridium unicorne]|uniref:Phosphomevalonate kinase n=1 Tax=Seiridium unicorne TaxID=138068 RepID=A0ABR2V4H0_9PEZI
MATLNSLKLALRQVDTTTVSLSKQPLPDTQYAAGFYNLSQGPGWKIYQEFIIPKLIQLLVSLFRSRNDISVLEIGPGPQTVFGHLPGFLRRKIRKYSAYEPNALFATKLAEWLCSSSEAEPPLPSLQSPPNIHPTPFNLDRDTGNDTGTHTNDNVEKYDIILFCHSMYGMNPKHRFIETTLEMLVERPEGGMVVVFHREGSLHLNDSASHRTASFPTGIISVMDEDEVLDSFASFVAGFIVENVAADETIRVKWRNICRDLGRREEAYPNCLLFSSPEVMVAFNQHATTLPKLAAQMPLEKGRKTVKNPVARLHRPASVVKPTEVRHIQECIRWALKHEIGLTVVSGAHSGHCLWHNVVSVDMGAFNQVHIFKAEENRGNSDYDSNALVVAEAGCNTGDIIRKTMAVGVTVPLGARPSVGAGLWLQGGIGHLARLHGLSCDSIIGAVMVSVGCGQIFCIGHVPIQRQPAGAVRPENENDLLWAIRGAGTNFGIVVSVTFKAYTAPTYAIQNWMVPLGTDTEARLRLSDFGKFVAGKLPRNCSADAYLFWDNGQLQLGVSMFKCSTTGLTIETPSSVDTVLGPPDTFTTVDGMGLFETELYISGMHGGHGGGKTSSFKRCLFLKNISGGNIVGILVAAVRTRPSPFCYLHLLQGGGAISDVAADATAFGCRDWDFACVITGVWPRGQDGTETARAAVHWVYNVVGDLLPLSSGAYGADLGPDPRDKALAAIAFGPNRPRLARLKHNLDREKVLSYTCQLPEAPMGPRLIVLVTGDSCAGKDYCSSIWALIFTNHAPERLAARVISISDTTKKEYATAFGADLERLLWDRAYKEQHRPALTQFFQDQVRRRPQLPEDHFLSVVYGAVDADVLLITGMRDEAPVAALSHLVPHSRLIEVHIKTSKETRRLRRGCHVDFEGDDDKYNKHCTHGKTNSAALGSRPALVFENSTVGDEAVSRFAKHYLLPFFHKDLQRLADMVYSTPNFPRLGIEFQHVLGISQQSGGLALCTSLLKSHFTSDWDKVDVLVSCEAGGFVFASALAARVDLPLVLIRGAGKLPPPIVSVPKSPSHISSSVFNSLGEEKIEMNRGAIPGGASVVVVDDVLATGRTLCAVLRLLFEAGISAENVSVMVVAEFPAHRGRELLHRLGFGVINIQSLLFFGGA